MIPPAPRRVLAVVPDLFFATRIAATAKLHGVELELVPEPRAAARCGEVLPALVLVDLQLAGAPALVAALKAAAPVPVVGFFSHIEPERRKAALAAGADAALPRSQFVTKLVPLLLRGPAALVPGAAEGFPS